MNLVLVAFSIDNNRVFLRDLHALCSAKHIDCGALELDSKIIRNNCTACQDCDILQHILSSVAISRCLDSNDRERSSQLIQNQGCKRLALNILRNDEQLFARLYDLLEQRENILDIADLLIRDHDIRIIQVGFHLLGIGCEIGGKIPSVKLHSFNQVQLCLHGLGFLNGDNTIL